MLYIVLFLFFISKYYLIGSHENFFIFFGSFKQYVLGTDVEIGKFWKELEIKGWLNAST